MASLRASYTLDRPQADVFAVITDVGDYPRWHPRVSSATMITEGPVGLGTRFRGTSRPFGRLDMEVTEYEEPKRIKFRVETNIANWDHLILLTAEGERTTVDHEYEIAPRGLGSLVAPLMGFIMSRTLDKAMSAFEQRLQVVEKYQVS